MSRNAFALLAIEDDDVPVQVQVQVQVQATPATPQPLIRSASAAPPPVRRVPYGWRPAPTAEAKKPEPEPFLSASNFPSLGAPSVPPKVAAGAWGATNSEARQRLVRPPMPHVLTKSPLPKRRYSDKRSRLVQSTHVVDMAPTFHHDGIEEEYSSDDTEDVQQKDDGWTVQW